ncbi:ABC transporter family substrate-binding protein [Bifidobacterium sp.]|jgi:peptide/nickel transport system substrate-binding protein|uniref:ABC transporter family substrate-binding protein n=1 Tax=Bifidobacterium sp. TaxID=41200 RepID=UPI0025BE0D7A|nr:ABC transporter family substrate-binding protein [Bifidobacterium sp.]MCH4209884.1 ABC transporter family substrate-binding protein [Bifidobacterium sp.]MCI1225539.1 ABC transporter family substrate-binding protein [Bifidobacterium sp.]
MQKTLGKQLLVAGAALSALAMLLSGCGAGNGSAAKTTGASKEQPLAGILTSDWKGTLPAPDPAKAYNNPQDYDNVKDGGELTLSSIYTANWNNFQVDGNTLYMGDFWQMYQPSLWNYTTNGEVSPNKDFLTGVKVTSQDPLTIEYDINPDAKWNDGTDIDWTAFETTWKVNSGKDEAYTPTITDGYEDIASVKAGTSAKQAIVTFTKPYYPYQSLFPYLLSPKSADAKTFNSGWIDNPHNDWAAGPFIVQSATKDQVVFVPNPKWWGAKPKLDKVTYKFLEDTATINAFKNGEIDAVGAGSRDNLKTVMGMKDVQLRLGYSLSTYVFEYNGKADSLKDIAVRKALTQAFDSSTWNKIAYQGLDWNPPQPGSEVVLPFQKGYKSNLPADAKFSVANAGKTLEAAGYTKDDAGYYGKDGKEINISYTYFGDSATNKAKALAYQQMMKTAGIKITLNNLDTSKWSDTVSKHTYEIMPLGWSATNPFGQTSLYQLYGSDSSSNFSFVGSKEIDEKLKKATTIEDNDEAIAATNEGESAALELYGTLPTDTPPTYTAVKKGLANFGPAGFQLKDWTKIGWQK